MSTIHPADHYRDAVLRMIELVDRAGVERWDDAVPSCPGWSVGDVLRHVAGLAADVVAGRVDGYAGPEWTRMQVAARAGRGWDDIKTEWLEVLPAMVEINRDLAGSALPDHIPHVFAPLPKTSFERAFLVDLVHHEFDVRVVLGQQRPAASESDQVVLGAQVATLRGAFAAHGLPTIVLAPTDADRDWTIGRDEPIAWVAAPMYDLLRSVGGRRTLDQIRALDWSHPVGDEVLAALVVGFFSAPDVPVED